MIFEPVKMIRELPKNTILAFINNGSGSITVTASLALGSKGVFRYGKAFSYDEIDLGNADFGSLFCEDFNHFVNIEIKKTG